MPKSSQNLRRSNVHALQSNLSMFARDSGVSAEQGCRGVPPAIRTPVFGRGGRSDGVTVGSVVRSTFIALLDRNRSTDAAMDTTTNAMTTTGTKRLTARTLS